MWGRSRWALALSVMTRRKCGTEGSLLDLETEGLSFTHLAKLGRLMATCHEIGSVL